jgi:hypothetical protein
MRPLEDDFWAVFDGPASGNCVHRLVAPCLCKHFVFLVSHHRRTLKVIEETQRFRDIALLRRGYGELIQPEGQILRVGVGAQHSLGAGGVDGVLLNRNEICIRTVFLLNHGIGGSEVSDHGVVVCGATGIRLEDPNLRPIRKTKTRQLPE